MNIENIYIVNFRNAKLFFQTLMFTYLKHYNNASKPAYFIKFCFIYLGNI